MSLFTAHHTAQRTEEAESIGSGASVSVKSGNDRHSAQPSRLAPPSQAPLSDPLNPSPPLPLISYPLTSPSRPDSNPRPHEFPSLTLQNLSDVIHDPSTLVLDIRSLASNRASRLINAVPLSVPSTFLRRPHFSIESLAEMLPSRAVRRRFAGWRSARRILVYDVSSTALVQGSSLLGLLRKFRVEQRQESRAGAGAGQPQRELFWLKGGYQAVWLARRDLVDMSPASEHNEEDRNPPPSSAPSIPPTVVLRIRNLPVPVLSAPSTPQSSSAIAYEHKWFESRRDDLQVKPEAGQDHENGEKQTMAPIASEIPLKTALAERVPLRISRSAKDRIHELPFAWLRKIGRWAVEDVGEGSSEANRGKRAMVADDVIEGAQALAMQFYHIELSEQRLLASAVEYRPEKPVCESGDAAEAFGRSYGEDSKTRRKSDGDNDHDELSDHSRLSRVPTVRFSQDDACTVPSIPTNVEQGRSCITVERR